MNPNEAGYYNNFWTSSVLIDQKKYDEVIIIYNKVIEMDPNEDSHYNNLGLDLLKISHK